MLSAVKTDDVNLVDSACKLVNSGSFLNKSFKRVLHMYYSYLVCVVFLPLVVVKMYF